MAMQRTTVSAPREALTILRSEAERRGITLTAIVAEAIEEKAVAVRGRRRPRLCLGASGGQAPGAAVLASEPIAEEPRL